MAGEEQTPADMNGNEPVDGAAQGEGSEPKGSAPGSAADDEGLTVDDILAAAQTGAAADADQESAEGSAEDAELSEAESHLNDLRRLSAEYANYRKRTADNAVIEKQRATAAAVMALLPVIDDLDRAEQHGDLEEGTAFATIAQKVRGALERMGLEGFGEKGEMFDPQVHEAIAQVPVPGTEQTTVLDVIERGYRIGTVELRPAKVAVAVAADG